MQYPQYPGQYPQYGQPAPPAGYPQPAQPAYQPYPATSYPAPAYPDPTYSTPGYPAPAYPASTYPAQTYQAPATGYAPPPPAPTYSQPYQYPTSPQPYVMPEMSWTVPQTTDTLYRDFGMDYNPFDYSAWSHQEYFSNPAPVYNFTPQEFQKLRNHSTRESAIKQLLEIGCDVSTTPIRLYTQPITRVCFCCVNTYTTPTRSLGVGPLNDAITVGANHRLMGYFVYFLHNPKSRVFMDYLKMFLKMTSENLTVYYTGHGTQVRDRSGDEADGYDEAMVFEDTYVLDDDLAAAVKKNCNGTCRVLLLNDCCRSGTIWDIPEDISRAERTFPPNVMSISSSKDSQTSKQVSGLGNVGSAQGLFTFHFFQHVRKNRGITPNQIRPLLNRDLQRYNQNVEIYPTRRTMLNEPIFPIQ